MFNHRLNLFIITLFLCLASCRAAPRAPEAIGNFSIPLYRKILVTSQQSGRVYIAMKWSTNIVSGTEVIATFPVGSDEAK